MENLNAEQAIKELENQTKFAKFTNSTGVLLSAKCAQFCLDHAQYYEQRIKELTEENERLKSVEFTCGFVKPHKVLECPIFDEIERTKADTVRQMQERFKSCFEDDVKYDGFRIAIWIDQIAKEMLEGEK